MSDKKTSQKKTSDKDVKKVSSTDSASEVKRTPRVQVTDFSSTKIKATLAMSLLAFVFLAVFPYKNITREQASYSLLFEYYYKKFENRFFYEDSLSGRTVQNENATSVPIVMYHGVMARPDAYNLHRDNFKDHLVALKTAGWETVTMDEFRAFRLGQVTLPAKSFLLTFDDGRKDSYYPVDPLLARLGYSAVMFTLPQYSIDHEEISPYYLNRGHIEKMYASGRWDIESHTWDGHSFFPLDSTGEQEGIFLANLLWQDDLGRRETIDEFRVRIVEDLTKADRSIKALTGKSVTTLAFPFGNYGNAGYNSPVLQSIVLEEAQKIHDLGFTQVRTGIYNGRGLSANYADAEDFLVERIDVNPLWSASDLLAVVEAGADKALPYEADMKDYVGFVAPSGVMRAEGNSLVLETSQIHSRARAFLDGGGLWQDYGVELDIKWERGEKLLLRTHGTVAEGGVACVFERNQMYVVADGVRSDLARVFYEDDTTRDRVVISAKVTATGGECSVDDVSLSFVFEEGQEPVVAGTVSVEVHDSSTSTVGSDLPLDFLEDDFEKGILRMYSLQAFSLAQTSIETELNSLE